MNENAKGTTMYETVPVVAELNRVTGFDPLKFARRISQPGNPGARLQLDLKYKKLWFRLKYPQGRLKVIPLRITEQIAIFEAKVFFDKKDTEPVSSYIATQNKKDTPGGLYIEYAQRNATDRALDDAGFGLQLVNVPVNQEKDPPVVQKAVVAEDSTSASETEEIKQAETASTPVTVENTPAGESPAAQSAEEAKADVAPSAELVEDTASAETADAEPERSDMITEEIDEETDQPADEAAETATASYTPDMPVEEICARITLEEAQNYIVDTGTCKGWPLSQVAERRPASLRFYVNGYQGDNNILRAGAKLLLNNMEAMNIAS